MRYLFLACCLFAGCNPSEPEITTKGLVKTIHGSTPNLNLDFTYDEQGRLIARSITSISSGEWLYEDGELAQYFLLFAGDGVRSLVQSEDGKVKRIETGLRTFAPPMVRHEFIYYQHDLPLYKIDSLLVGYDDDDLEMVYEGRTDYYLDGSGNMIRSVMYNGTDTIQEYQYVYDNHVNPLHGHFTSWEEGFTAFTSPNNVVESTFTDYQTPENSRARSFQFTYFESTYPSSINSESIEYIDF